MTLASNGKMQLRMLSWPGYISPATLEQFEAEFDVQVVVESLPSAIEMMERMHSAPVPDLLCPPEYLVRDLNTKKLLLTLDHNLLPNLKYLSAEFTQSRPHDPSGAVSVIKDWGTTGFMYRTDQVSESPQSWKDFWALAEKYSGQVSALDSPGEVIGAALKKNGYSYNASDPVALAAAKKDLLVLKRHVSYFETDYRPLLSSGKVKLALGWNGDAAALSASSVPIRYVVPLEGSQIWEDDWAIAHSTQSPVAAHAFINFVLRPEVAAQEANYTHYATGNRAAFDLLEESIRGDQATYPNKDVMTKLERGLPLEPEAARKRDDLWKEIRM